MILEFVTARNFHCIGVLELGHGVERSVIFFKNHTYLEVCFDEKVLIRGRRAVSS
jgi:hypothetical protein